MATPRLCVVVTAAGRSERFGGGKKELADLGGQSVLDRAISPFLELPNLVFLVVTAPKDGLETVRAAISESTKASLGSRLMIVAGGETRRDSVRAGLESIASALGGEMRGEDIVLVHDGARPWASPGLAARVVALATREGAALPLIPLTDTPKRISPPGPDGRPGLVLEHPARSSLAGAQTPQGFRLLPLLAAHRRAAEEGFDCTDDAELWARYASPSGAGPVAWLEGEAGNKKLTFRSDLEREVPSTLRIGEGWDLHRLSRERRLFLGGLELEAEAGEIAHSDGDVLLHAIIDALLGGASLGDIGLYFPPSDERWRNADSKDLARKAVGLVREAGYEPVNLDCTVILESPRLSPHREALKASIASILGLPLASVSVKAKTSEGVDAVGRREAIEARAVVLLRPRG